MKKSTAHNKVLPKAGFVLRMKLFRKFEHSCFVSKVVLKIRSLAKPRPVMRHFIQTRFQNQFHNEL